jgi:tetratricopeptide (TPR) repeat protein
MNKKKKYDAAKDVLDVLLHMEPENLDALNLKAIIFYLKGHRMSAKNIYRKINEISDNYKYSLGNMALIYYNEKEYENALKTAKKALDSDPTDPVALRFGNKSRLQIKKN